MFALLFFLPQNVWAQGTRQSLYPTVDFAALVPADLRHVVWQDISVEARRQCDKLEKVEEFSDVIRTRIDLDFDLMDHLNSNIPLLDDLEQQVNWNFDRYGLVDPSMGLRRLISEANLQIASEAEMLRADADTLAHKNLNPNDRRKGRLHGQKLAAARAECHEHLMTIVLYSGRTERFLESIETDLNSTIGMMYAAYPEVGPPVILYLPKRVAQAAPGL